MKKNSSRKWLYIIVFVFVLFFLFGNKHWWKMLSLMKEVRRLKAEVSQVKIENERLLKEEERLKNDLDYIEEIARDELGLVKPGEIEYRIRVNNQPVRVVTDDNAR